ncbi:hypothetical protein VTK26DRAFT_5694 [Humicola hyalothermophila]
MSSSIPLQLAETVQTAHLQPEPSPQHDLNPSTAASKREPVRLEPARPDDVDIDLYDYDEQQQQQRRRHQQQKQQQQQQHHYTDEEDVEETDEDDDDLYPSRVKPRSRRSFHHLPPIPDLRFEQSYLWSIRNADSWWKIVWITVRDQVMMPFVQGIVYNLAICGWQRWNRNARIHGSSIGARLRRWWYRVNKWAIPPEKPVKEG